MIYSENRCTLFGIMLWRNNIIVGAEVAAVDSISSAKSA
jgi:hypothetical protein